MSNLALTVEQQDDIKGYCCPFSISCMTGEEIERTQNLIATNPVAKEFFKKHERLNDQAVLLSAMEATC
mgnify:CR=1 FL=1|tara:strand:- start:170 stop:376 length:207 start_codon:yes stop_codon:yes gene_type:complete